MILEKTKQSFFSNQSEVYYLDTDTGREYQRIFASMAWPGKHSGYAVVVAEERDADKSLGEHKLWILAEYESPNPSDLVKRCREFKSLFCIDRIYGNSKNLPMMGFMRGSGFRLSDAPFADSPNAGQYYLSLIREMTEGATRKILFFGKNSKLPGILATLDTDHLKAGNDFSSELPPIVALGYVLAALKTYTHNPNEGMDIEPEPEEIY